MIAMFLRFKNIDSHINDTFDSPTVSYDRCLVELINVVIL